jgi:hypothetical protein
MSETAFLGRYTTINERYLLSVDNVCASVVELFTLRFFGFVIAFRYIFSPEAALLGRHRRLQRLPNRLVVGVRRREAHSAGDAVDVGVDGEDAAAAAGKEEDAVGGFRPDAADVEEAVAHSGGVALADEVVERVGAAEVGDDFRGRLDDHRRFLVVEWRLV